jgi:hypothetical protein
MEEYEELETRRLAKHLLLVSYEKTTEEDVPSESKYTETFNEFWSGTLENKFLACVLIERICDQLSVAKVVYDHGRSYWGSYLGYAVSCSDAARILCMHFKRYNVYRCIMCVELREVLIDLANLGKVYGPFVINSIEKCYGGFLKFLLRSGSLSSYELRGLLSIANRLQTSGNFFLLLARHFCREECPYFSVISKHLRSVYTDDAQFVDLKAMHGDFDSRTGFIKSMRQRQIHYHRLIPKLLERVLCNALPYGVGCAIARLVYRRILYP